MEFDLAPDSSLGSCAGKGDFGQGRSFASASADFAIVIDCIGHYLQN